MFEIFHFNITLVVALEVGLTAFTVVGQEYITRRNSRGYYYWIVSNILGLILFAITARWLMVLLYSYFGINCLRGIRNWSELDRLAPLPRVAEDFGHVLSEPAAGQTSLFRKFASTTYVKLFASATSRRAEGG